MGARRSVGRLSAAILSSLALLPVARGVTVDYGVDVGVGESDNVTLVSRDKVSQTMAVTDLDFTVLQQSRLLNLDAKGDFSYLDYLQNAYSAHLFGRFDGSGEISIVPGRLSWLVQDSFGQTQIDPFAAVTPTNQEDVNYFSTGPNLSLRFGPMAFMDATARFARTDYETSPFNSNRFSASVAFGAQLSARSSVSLDASSERVLFENTLLNTDFDRSSVYAHYEAHGARTDLTANLGVTDVDQGGQTIRGPLAKLEVSRSLTAAAKLRLTVGRDLTDASTAFNSQSGIGGVGGIGGIGGNTSAPGVGIVGIGTTPAGAIATIGTTPAAATSTNYTVTYSALGWEYQRNRTTLGLSGRWEKDSYGGEPLLNLNRANLEFNIERRLTRLFTAQVTGSLYRTDYAQTNFSETDGRVGGGLVWREGRGLELKLRYDHTSRIVGGTGSGTGYEENRVFLTVGYRPLPRVPPTT